MSLSKKPDSWPESISALTADLILLIINIRRVPVPQPLFPGGIKLLKTYSGLLHIKSFRSGPIIVLTFQD